jgi:signal transduction histidine kinase
MREDDELILSVSDTGVGIPLADQERIFEKFERGRSETYQTGAGLGLSLVKSLIELHGGRVTIESTPKRGTTVSCVLPAGPETAAASPLLDAASTHPAD